MDAILQSGLDLIVAIQRVHGPVLDSVFRAFTFMGEEAFYLLLLPLLFWCVDFGFGARLTVILLLSGYVNVSLKDWFQQPRPFDIDPGVRLSSAEGYGLPSGHAQSAVVLWGSLAAWSGRAWFWGAAIALMFLIGFSRVYLGVHFPTDVLAGWAIGLLVLVLYRSTQPGAEAWLERLSRGRQMLVALAVAVLLLLIHPSKDTAAAMGVLAGMGIGLSLSYRHVAFNARGPWKQRIMRFLVGGAIVVVLYLGLRLLLPGEGSRLYLAFRLLRFGLIGVWVTLGAPWLFRRLRLISGGGRPAVRR